MEKVKSLNFNKCPHCNQDILVEFMVTPPEILSVLTPADITNAKDQVVEAVRDMTGLSDEEKEKAFNWILSEETAFGPAEVDTVVASIKDLIK